MARIRTIKPEFFTSADVVSLTPLARLFYVSLWCEADREGRFKWDVLTLRMRYLPADDCDIEALASELEGRDLIVIYEVDGKQYAEIPSFKTHQVINNREAESVLPARVKGASPRVQAEGRKEGKGTEGKGTETHFVDGKPSTQSKPKRKCQLPDDFALNEERVTAAASYWFSKNREDLCTQVQDQFDQFLAHHRGKGSTMADWDAAWQTWYCNAVKFTKPQQEARYASSQRPNREPVGERIRNQAAAVIARIEDREARGFALGEDG